MTSLVQRLARPEILAMPPLDLEPPVNLADVIKLDANESPFPPLAGGALAAEVNRYPESRPHRLRDVMAALYGVEPGQLLVFKPGAEIIAKAHAPARVMLLGGEPMDGPRHIWWNFVSSSKERIEQAKADWQAGRFAKVPGETEFIPLPEGP